MNEKERQALQQMEDALRHSDPQLVKKLQGAKAPKSHPRAHPNTIVPRANYQGPWQKILQWAQTRWDARQGTY